MRTSRLSCGLVLALGLALLAPGPARATPVLVDFTALGPDKTLLAKRLSLDGLVATGWVRERKPTALHPRRRRFLAAHLWLRDHGDDLGLGVCSERRRVCRRRGAYAEMDDKGRLELIGLAKPDGAWTSLWVASLDGPERGRLYWSYSPNPNVALRHPEGFFDYASGDFGAAEGGDLLTLAAAAGFDRDAPYLFFRPGPPGAGHDNDHLVWKAAWGATAVPEPGTLPLLGAGLLGLLALGRLPARPSAHGCRRRA